MLKFFITNDRIRKIYEYKYTTIDAILYQNVILPITIIS